MTAIVAPVATGRLGGREARPRAMPGRGITSLDIVVRASRYRGGYGDWPKDGDYCDRCGALALKARE